MPVMGEITSARSRCAGLPGRVYGWIQGSPLCWAMAQGVFVEERAGGEAAALRHCQHRRYFQLLLTRLRSLLEPRVGRSPPSCLHHRKIPAAVSWGWTAMATGACPGLRGAAASCRLLGRSHGAAPRHANRLMERTNLGSQEKMPFSFLSFLFWTWLQWDWTDWHPQGRSSLFLRGDAAARPRCMERGPVRTTHADRLHWGLLPCSHRAHKPGMVERACCASRLNHTHVTDHALLTEIKSSLSL